MFNNLRPLRLPVEAVEELVAQEGIRVIPQRPNIILIKGDINNSFLQALARQNKEGAWFSPKQGQVTLKIILTEENYKLFKGLCVYTKEELVTNCVSKIYTSKFIVSLRPGHNDTAVAGISMIRVADQTLYLENDCPDEFELRELLREIKDEVGSLVSSAVDLVQSGVLADHIKNDDGSTTAIVGNNAAIINPDKSFLIRDLETGEVKVSTKCIVEFLCFLNA